MWPAIKPAAEICGNGKIIVMATETTLASKRGNELIELYCKDKEVYKLPCPKINLSYLREDKVQLTNIVDEIRMTINK